MNFRFLFSLVFLFVFTSTLYSQHSHDSHNHEKEHEHHHSSVEIGVSNGYVYNLTEEEGAYGIHVHLVKSIGEKFGLGLGYEAIFDDHKHNAASLIFEYRATEHLLINFAPGVAWLATESNSAKPSLHLEGIYAWQLGVFHLGPIIGVASNFEDYHASIGLHIAVGF